MIKLKEGQRFIPLRNTVLVKVDPVEERTEGGLYIPDDAREIKEIAGESGVVVDKGASAMFDDEGFEEDVLLVGKRVGYRQYCGVELMIGADRYRIMNDTDLLGYVE